MTVTVDVKVKANLRPLVAAVDEPFLFINADVLVGIVFETAAAYRDVAHMRSDLVRELYVARITDRWHYYGLGL